jgi:glucosamine--fructose-6-phosphate aminotransferase (isomerizing)
MDHGMNDQGFFTKEEIYSQPEIWEQSLHVLQAGKWDHLPALNDFDQIYLAGCGSTHYLSIWAALLLQTRTGVCSRPLPASELWLQPDIWVPSARITCLLAISRSGTTTETIEAVKHFKSKPEIAIIVITCYPDSDLAQLADSLIPFPAAQEKSIAQTRSFSNMMLGIPFLVQQKVEKGLPEKLRGTGSQLIERHSSLMKDLANDRSMQRFFFLGSGSRYGLACEAMLKMKEMSLSYSEAYHFLEFRHGPMSMVDKESLVVGLLGDQNRTQELRVLQEMKKFGGTILAIGKELKGDIPGWIDHFIPLNASDLNGYGDVLYLPPLQLLAYERAVGKGLDPDHPHNLDAVVILDE